MPWFEMLTWGLVGLLLSVIELAFLKDKGIDGTVVLTGVGGAATGGLFGHYVSLAVGPPAGYSYLALAFAGIGAVVFLMIGWLVRRHKANVLA